MQIVKADSEWFIGMNYIQMIDVIDDKNLVYFKDIKGKMKLTVVFLPDSRNEFTNPVFWFSTSLWISTFSYLVIFQVIKRLDHETRSRAICGKSLESKKKDIN